MPRQGRSSPRLPPLERSPQARLPVEMVRARLLPRRPTKTRPRQRPAPPTLVFAWPPILTDSTTSCSDGGYHRTSEAALPVRPQKRPNFRGEIVLGERLGEERRAGLQQATAKDLRGEA